MMDGLACTWHTCALCNEYNWKVPAKIARKILFDWLGKDYQFGLNLCLSCGISCNGFEVSGETWDEAKTSLFNRFG